VFGGSNLRVSTCDPRLSVTGSACVEFGSVAWSGSGCADEVAIATPSGTIRLQGTWVSATYVEERQLTLFAVLDGTAEAIPVVDPEAATLALGTALEPGTFWFSVPGDAPVEIAGLPARQALPFDRLPDLVRELHLESWFGAILRQASADGIDVSRVPEMPVITVRFGGPQFASAEAREAALVAFDWRSRSLEAFGRDDLAVVALGADDPPRDLMDLNQDTGQAIELALGSGLVGAGVTWDPSPELDQLVQEYLASLREIQFEEFSFAATDFQAPPGETASGIYNEFAVDAPIIWIERR
jgi:hypothetical protein